MRSVRSVSSSRRRYQVERDDTLYTCEHCPGFCFRGLKVLNEHIITEHPDQDTVMAYKCMFCDAGIDTLQNFEIHLKTSHQQEDVTPFVKDCFRCRHMLVQRDKVVTVLYAYLDGPSMRNGACRSAEEDSLHCRRRQRKEVTIKIEPRSEFSTPEDNGHFDCTAAVGATSNAESEIATQSTSLQQSVDSSVVQNCGTPSVSYLDSEDDISIISDPVNCDAAELSRLAGTFFAGGRYGRGKPKPRKLPRGQAEKEKIPEQSSVDEHVVFVHHSPKERKGTTVAVNKAEDMFINEIVCRRLPPSNRRRRPPRPKVQNKPREVMEQPQMQEDDQLSFPSGRRKATAVEKLTALTCIKCGRKFKNRCVLTRHMIEHKRAKNPYKCLVIGCLESYNEKKKLISHLNRRHPTLPNVLREAILKKGEEDEQKFELQDFVVEKAKPNVVAQRSSVVGATATDSVKETSSCVLTDRALSLRTLKANKRMRIARAKVPTVTTEVVSGEMIGIPNTGNHLKDDECSSKPSCSLDLSKVKEESVPGELRSVFFSKDSLSNGMIYADERLTLRNVEEARKNPCAESVAVDSLLHLAANCVNDSYGCADLPLRSPSEWAVRNGAMGMIPMQDSNVKLDVTVKQEIRPDVDSCFS